MLTSTKSAGKEPESEIEFNRIVAVPLFVNVMLFASEVAPWRVVAKLKLVELNPSGGTGVPVPVRVTLCGEPAALSVMVRTDDNEAAEPGRKATRIKQRVPGASDVPQVPTCTNEEGEGPVNPIELIVRAAEPVFLR